VGKAETTEGFGEMAARYRGEMLQRDFSVSSPVCMGAPFTLHELTGSVRRTSRRVPCVLER